jgi:hypothetical protein
MPITQLPKYSDGLQATTELSVLCYNNNTTYLCYDGDPSESATQKEWTDSDMSPIGSDTRVGFRKGTINLQYNLAVDEAPGSANLVRPGYVISFRSRFYVCGEPKTKIIKNDVIKFAVTVLEIQNPIIPNLLTTIGQQKTANINANVAATVNCAAIGTRTGANVTYSLESFATQGSAAPAGISIAANGLLTANVGAGAYDVRVIAIDTLAGQSTQYGQGRYTPTAS